MATIKLQELEEDLFQDMRIVLQRYQLTVDSLKAGTSGLQGMWRLLSIVSRNRAYDDEHPAFASGHWVRVLPFDGRAYTWYYVNGANDDHVAALLHRVRRKLHALSETAKAADPC